MEKFSSKLIEDAVNEISKLPGIGKRTALRLVLHILREDVAEAEALGEAVIRLRRNISYCKICHNISDSDVCDICSGHKRNKSVICVVKDIRDVIAIENTSQFNGVYHVLGGIISPMDGIGPADLNIESLTERIKNGGIEEIVMALSTTIEGDTTVFYIYKKLKDFNIRFTTIARGISMGDELEYADEVTLGRSIINRTPYSNEQLSMNNEQ